MSRHDFVYTADAAAGGAAPRVTLNSRSADARSAGALALVTPAESGRLRIGPATGGVTYTRQYLLELRRFADTPLSGATVALLRRLGLRRRRRGVRAGRKSRRPIRVRVTERPPPGPAERVGAAATAAGGLCLDAPADPTGRDPGGDGRVRRTERGTPQRALSDGTYRRCESPTVVPATPRALCH